MRQREKMAVAKKLEKLNGSILTAVDLLMNFVEANEKTIAEITGKPATDAKNAPVDKKAKKSEVAKDAKTEKPAKKVKKAIKKK